MRGTVNGVTTFYPGRHYNKEVSPGATKIQKFYFAGTVTIAVRTLTDTADTLNWVVSDHLGSTSTTANENGSLNSIIQYTAFGEIRLTQGITPTKYRYTGQLAQAELGLDYYVARWYDPLTAHFTSADTIIPEPGRASAFDRYCYSYNNPIIFIDPGGHSPMGECGPGEDCEETDEEKAEADRNELLNIIKDDEKNGCKYGGCDNGAEIAAFTVISLITVSGISVAVEGLLSTIGIVKTASEIGSATETINLACQGDCSDEAKQIMHSGEELLPSVENVATQAGKEIISSSQQVSTNVLQVADDVENWLGKDLVSIRNDAGDFILRNVENTKKIRFDFNDTSPHLNPHIHLEWLNEAGKWINNRIYPSDVLPK